MYILRYIEYTNRPKSPPWSLRQYVVYNRYVPDCNDWCSTWILLGKSKRAEQCVDEYANNNKDLKIASPFELHVLFIDVALASWRPYIVDLNTDVKEFVNDSQWMFNIFR